MFKASRRILKTVLCNVAVVAGAAAALAQSPDNQVPVRIVRGYLMVVKASVNGHPSVDFLVDTGSNTTLLDPQLVRELQLEPVGRVMLNSLASAAPMNRYLLDNLRIGPAAVSNLEALVMPLTELQAIDHKIRGIVGLNFLLQFSFLLDYEQQHFQVLPFPDRAVVPAGFRVSAEIHAGRILIPVTSNASPRKSWKLSLDSGISQLLLFTQRLDVRSSELDRCRDSGCVTNISTNLARQEARSLRLRHMGIAEVSFSDVPLVVLSNDQLDPRDPADGLLPATLFSSLFFDRTNATIVFNPIVPVVARR
jgi:hypothetical protein